MVKYLDDIFIIIGCLLILAGTYQINPLATWFVGGGMFIVAGVLVGAGERKIQ
jgi:hypothetical protein